MSRSRAQFIGRRAVLARWGILAGGVAAGGLLQACAPAAPPATSAPAASAPPAPTTGTAKPAAPAVPPATAAPAAPAATPATAAKTLQFAEPFEAKSYDGQEGKVALVRQGIGQTLVQVGFDSKIQPTLATALEPVDATTWRFTLRPNVQLHNGKALDSSMVKTSLERLAASKDALQAIQGAVVTTDGPLAGRIQTKQPVSYLPALLADGSAAILDPASFAGDGTVAQPIGTGPFKLVEYRPGDRRVLQAHEAYWGGTPKVRDVQYRLVTQAQTRSNLIRTGEVDIARSIPATEAPALKGAAGISLLSVPLPRIRALYPNTQSGPTSDVRVRRALAHATDRDIIVKTVLENEGTAQATIFRPDVPWGNPGVKGLPFDRERAKALLAEAGYGPSRPLALSLLTYTTRAELPLIAQVLQQQYAAVGVDLQIGIQDFTVIENTALKEGTHNLVLFARNPLLVYDPQSILESDYTTTGSYNLSRYGGVEEKMKAVPAETAARYDLFRAVEKQIVEDDVATIVLSTYIQVDAVRAGITGYQPHPTDLLALTERIDKA